MNLMNLTDYHAKYFAYGLTKRCSMESLGKLYGQRQVKTLEQQRNAKRRALFDAQDEIDHQRERSIAEIEGKLQQRASLIELFKIRWRLA